MNSVMNFNSKGNIELVKETEKPKKLKHIT